MKSIIGYIKEYIRFINKKVFFICLLFITLLIVLNYSFHLTKSFPRTFWPAWISWYLLFLITFTFGYAITAWIKKNSLLRQRSFIILLLVAPMIFAWKMVYHVHFDISDNPPLNAYWNSIIYYPFKLIVVAFLLCLVWKYSKEPSTFYGATLKDFDTRPYLLMLLIMIPLIALASTQTDFLQQYPRFQSIAFLREPNTGWYKLLYELSYGTDFLTIELFFRGFLILGFIKYAGKDAILPMALFYCTIHFGKPLGECISSFFGGLILGAVIYNTRSIFGGLIVHLGIAWLMELGGYIGGLYFK